MRMLTTGEIKLKIISPTWLFIIIILTFNYIPTVWIVFTDYVPRKQLYNIMVFRDAAWMYFLTLNVFLVSFITSRFLFYYEKSTLFTFQKSQQLKELYDLIILINPLAMFSVVISIVFVALYSFNGGLTKLLLLGTEMDGRDYRFFNFNEVPRIYTACLQIARRFILPLLVVYLYTCYTFKLKKTGLLLLFVIALQLYASALTFARAPFLTLIVGLFLVRLIIAKNTRKSITEATMLIFSVIILAGLTTQLQYNIVDFDYLDILITGTDFLLNRAWFVPNVVPINLVFVEFGFYSDPLLLEYSRLGGLIGLKVVGTLQKTSDYVAPVGYVGDIWRNFGIIGIVITGHLFGLLFMLLDRSMAKLGLLSSMVQLFLIVAAVFYWIMGVVFSQGAVLSVILILLFPLIAKKIESGNGT